MYIVTQWCRNLGNVVVPAHPTLRLQSSWQVPRASVKGTRRATVVQSGTPQPAVMQRKWKRVPVPSSARYRGTWRAVNISERVSRSRRKTPCTYSDYTKYFLIKIFSYLKQNMRIKLYSNNVIILNIKIIKCKMPNLKI